MVFHFILLQERTGSSTFDHQNLTLQYKLDNEFELIFVVAYQKILKLSYVDKFLSDAHLEFRDKYKNELQGSGDASRYFSQRFEFGVELRRLVQLAEKETQLQAQMPRQMRSFSDSAKSKKTVSSMIERKDGDPTMGGKKVVRIVEAAEKETNGGGLNEDVLIENRRRMAEKLAKKGGGKYVFRIYTNR